MKIKKISQIQTKENVENKTYTVRSMLNDLKKWKKILKEIQ